MNYDYRNILRNSFDQRASRNSQYSLRSFARDLDVPPPRLSDILNNKRGTSLERGKKIATRLNLGKKETDLFLLSIQALHSRSPKAKSVAERKLLERFRNDEKNFLDEDKFSLIANWYHYAILELLTTDDKFTSELQIAKRLGISHFCAKEAVTRLGRLNLIAKDLDGNFIALTETTCTTNDVASAALKLHQEEQLKLSQKALYEQDVNTREIGSTTIAVDKEQVPELKELIRDFRKKIAAIADNSQNKNSVYLLGTQLIRLDKELENEND
ncbi:MAG: TIGR02147 family protein [Bacteriovoracaceae bacterium]|nr:TIGR02147 family protein [Bacteriovoracaceae bacterium]